MTLTVKFYSYTDTELNALVGELRWTEGGKVEIVWGRGLEWLVNAPIKVGGPQIFCSESALRAFPRCPRAHRVVDAEAFMRGLCHAYCGHFYASVAKETE
jgi:hypothetical protein